MGAVRFCSECGARLKLKQITSLPFRSFCRECSPRNNRIRLMLFAVPVICAAIGFAAGHYASVHEPFYFIGTPIDLSAGSAPSNGGDGGHSSAGNVIPAQPGQPQIQPNAGDALCGARTKSGKPCRRRVKGGGFCWQHRNGPAAAK